MTENEKEFLALILNNVTFTHSGIQPYSISLHSFCKIFKIETVNATDQEIINKVHNIIIDFTSYQICENSEYGKKIFCGYKINWVTGIITISPNPALEKMQKKWKQLKN